VRISGGDRRANLCHVAVVCSSCPLPSPRNLNRALESLNVRRNSVGTVPTSGHPAPVSGMLASMHEPGAYRLSNNHLGLNAALKPQGGTIRQYARSALTPSPQPPLAATPTSGCFILPGYLFPVSPIHRKCCAMVRCPVRKENLPKKRALCIQVRGLAPPSASVFFGVNKSSVL
jgi:hypothetical protein